MFEKLQLKGWEKKDEADKTFNKDTDYFEENIDDNETYEANDRVTAKRLGFKSAMQVKDERLDADTGDDIRGYIEDLVVSSSVDQGVIQQMQKPSSCWQSALLKLTLYQGVRTIRTIW